MTNNKDTQTDIQVEVVYGLPDRQKLLKITVPNGSTVEQVIELSGIKKHFPDLKVEKKRVGIWNRTCSLTDTVREQDRVEIYRPLIADPRENRRLRAEKAIKEGRANPVTGGRVQQ